MTKMTIATDKKGNVIGAIQQRAGAEPAGAPHTSVTFAPGHKLHMVDVAPELDMAKAKDPAAFNQALKRYVPKAG